MKRFEQNRIGQDKIGWGAFGLFGSEVKGYLRRRSKVEVRFLDIREKRA